MAACMHRSGEAAGGAGAESGGQGGLGPALPRVRSWWHSCTQRSAAPTQQSQRPRQGSGSWWCSCCSGSSWNSAHALAACCASASSSRASSPAAEGGRRAARRPLHLPALACSLPPVLAAPSARSRLQPQQGVLPRQAWAAQPAACKGGHAPAAAGGCQGRGPYQPAPGRCAAPRAPWTSCPWRAPCPASLSTWGRAASLCRCLRSRAGRPRAEARRRRAGAAAAAAGVERPWHNVLQRASRWQGGCKALQAWGPPVAACCAGRQPLEGGHRPALLLAVLLQQCPGQPQLLLRRGRAGQGQGVG
jgi:hypothetical protein